MPLPPLPTKPATLIDTDSLPAVKPGRKSRPAKKDATVPATPAVQPDTATATVTPRGKASSAGLLLSPATDKTGNQRSKTHVPSTSASPAPAAAAARPAADASRPGSTAPAATIASGKAAAQGGKQVPSQPPQATPTTGKHAARVKTARKPEARTLFVLDTNVLLHDPSSLFRFQEHDIFLPMMMLEELDHNKKGMSEVARNARQVSRSLDELVGLTADIAAGIPLNALGSKEARGLLYFQTSAVHNSLPADLPMGKADNQILGVVQALQQKHGDRPVVLVSKDINMRLKARALGLAAEDYFNDQVLEDSDLLYSGMLELPASFWNKHGKDIESWQQGGRTFYRLQGPLCAQFLPNQFVYFEGDMPLYAQVQEVSGKTAVLATLRDYTHAKNNVWGVTARNREQNFALNLLMNPDCDFVSLLGQAGTGKTLLALACGLAQVLETKRYSEIIITRATVPVGDDIGFLPGTEEEKMLPWMGALEDNLDVLNTGDQLGNSQGAEWNRAATMDLIRSRIKVKSLNFMRGRTFLNKFLIIDEAQNLTPKQMKTLITRAGPGTKVVCLGNIAQIDTPYLTEGSSGLTYVVDRFKGWPHSGHITLQRGERSRLADYAADTL